MKKFLVLTDFSPASVRAVEQASRLALPLEAEVHLLHKVVYPPPHPPAELLDRLDDAAQFEYVLKEVIERPEREAGEALERAASDLRRAGVRVETHLERSGDVYERVEAAIEAMKPDLVVMGTHGRSGIDKWLMGSVAEKVLRHAPVDVLALHADTPVAGGKGGVGEVVVPTDFSECSGRALDAAFELVGRLGGSVYLLHVIEGRFLPRTGKPVEPSEELRAECERALRGELAEREGQTALGMGNVAREIDRVARARGGSLILLGTHGRGGIRNALIGSVAERVTRISRLPVWTVR